MGRTGTAPRPTGTGSAGRRGPPAPARQPSAIVPEGGDRAGTPQQGRHERSAQRQTLREGSRHPIRHRAGADRPMRGPVGRDKLDLRGQSRHGR
ncbi:hypothetical protein [Streptomyces scabiei]|uniref:hypothetical protein n=1 Tax=Streptomyces scabiei TaxID=1930 RepID=UPI000A4ACE4D